MTHVITLPYPISGNRYKAPRIVYAKGSRVPTIMWYLTAEAKAYKTEVGWLVKKAGLRTPYDWRVRVGIELYPHRPKDYRTRMRKHGEAWDDDVESLDLDNTRKVLLDALNGIAYIDDKWIWEDWGRRMEPDEHGKRVVVTIEPLPRPVRQAGLELVVAPRVAERAPF